jgi:predicted metal-binding membrane protein
LDTLAVSTRLVVAGSIVFSGLGLGLIMFGDSPNSFFHLFPGLNIEVGTLVVVPFSFLFAFWARDPKTSLWRLGLFWGLNEITWAMWALLYLPSYLVGELYLQGWPVYISAVLCLFLLSCYKLRGRFKLRGLAYPLLFGVGFMPVWIAATLNVQFLPFLGVDTVRDLLIVSGVALAVDKEVPPG